MAISQIVTNSVASGQTFTSPVFAGTPTGVGVLTSGTAQASTSGTSIDFTGIPSWVKRITVMFNNVSLSGTADIWVQIGSGSVETTGYSSGAYAYGTSANAITGGMVIISQYAPRKTYGTMVLCHIGSNLWVSSSAYSSDPGGGGSGGGTKTTSGVLDRVRITTSNGTDTFDFGSINILYE